MSVGSGHGVDGKVGWLCTEHARGGDGTTGRRWFRRVTNIWSDMAMQVVRRGSCAKPMMVIG